jgi:hypothetical protein
MSDQPSLPLAMPTMHPMRCANPSCGDQFLAERSTRKFCSDSCRQQNHRDRRNGKARTVTQSVVVGTSADMIVNLAPLASRM